jgi:imidazoleglycerol-phosphate dehydratase/histidinol-phosphatase
MQKYAFLDRDGTFLYEPTKPAGVDPRETFPPKSMAEFQFIDNAIEGMHTLVDAGYKLVMVTNQTFLGTAKHPKPLFDEIMSRIDAELAKRGMKFEFIMVCPHGPDENCECRKPKTGGLSKFLKDREGQIDLEHSLMFGDRSTDEEFANNLSVRFIPIKTNERFIVPDNI